MTLARALLVALALAVGVAVGLPNMLRAVREFHHLTAPKTLLPAASPPGGHAAGGPHAAVAAADGPPAAAHPMITRRHAGGSSWLGQLAIFGTLGGVAVFWLAAIGLCIRRARRRHTRQYALYELHLSTHDQAKEQDLEDLIEQVANIVRVWPAERARNGQPYVALELICSAVQTPGARREMEWSINIRCEPSTVVALDGALSAAYPDVRLGRIHGEEPRPRPGRLREPGCLMRFRKERSFVYSLIADGEQQASSPLEQIARAQITQGQPSVVRFQLTPTPASFEALVRRFYRHHEARLMRHERSGPREGGLFSTFNRAEMRAAERTQNRSLFWLETVVAADDRDVCKAVAAAVQSRRGENRLHRWWMYLRQGLYRRRFPLALGPLVPSPRCLVSAAEVAHLLELPSARMKGVPVRRVTIPRIPAPPEVFRGSRARTEGPTPKPVVGESA